MKAKDLGPNRRIRISKIRSDQDSEQIYLVTFVQKN